MAQSEIDKKSQKTQKAKAKEWAANRHKLIDELAKKPPHKPKVILDPIEIEKMATQDATAEEIAAYFGCSKDIIYNNKDYFDALKRGRDKGNSSLKRLGYEIAMQDRNVNMTVFLLKARCGYNDGGNQGTQEQMPFKEKTI